MERNKGNKNFNNKNIYSETNQSSSMLADEKWKETIDVNLLLLIMSTWVISGDIHKYKENIIDFLKDNSKINNILKKYVSVTFDFDFEKNKSNANKKEISEKIINYAIAIRNYYVHYWEEDSDEKRNNKEKIENYEGDSAKVELEYKNNSEKIIFREFIRKSFLPKDIIFYEGYGIEHFRIAFLRVFLSNYQISLLKSNNFFEGFLSNESNKEIKRIIDKTISSSQRIYLDKVKKKNINEDDKEFLEGVKNKLPDKNPINEMVENLIRFNEKKISKAHLTSIVAGSFNFYFKNPKKIFSVRDYKSSEVKHEYNDNKNVVKENGKWIHFYLITNKKSNSKVFLPEKDFINLKLYSRIEQNLNPIFNHLKNDEKNEYESRNNDIKKARKNHFESLLENERRGQLIKELFKWYYRYVKKKEFQNQDLWNVDNDNKPRIGAINKVKQCFSYNKFDKIQISSSMLYTELLNVEQNSDCLKTFITFALENWVPKEKKNKNNSAKHKILIDNDENEEKIQVKHIPNHLLLKINKLNEFNPYINNVFNNNHNLFFLFIAIRELFIFWSSSDKKHKPFKINSELLEKFKKLHFYDSFFEDIHWHKSKKEEEIKLNQNQVRDVIRTTLFQQIYNSFPDDNGEKVDKAFELYKKYTSKELKVLNKFKDGIKDKDTRNILFHRSFSSDMKLKDIEDFINNLIISK